MNFVPAHDPPEPRVAPRPCILLVEDEDAVAMVATIALEEEGWQVQRAATGAAAIACIDRPPGSFLAVLLDLGLPDIPGADVLRHAQSARPELPVIACSGGPSPTPSGVLAMLRKPYKFEQLMGLIRGILRSAQ